MSTSRSRSPTKLEGKRFVVDQRPTASRAKGSPDKSPLSTQKDDFRKKFKLTRVSEFKKIIKFAIALADAIKRFTMFFEKRATGDTIEFPIQTGEGGNVTLVKYTYTDVTNAVFLFETGMSNLYYYLKFRGSKGAREKPSATDFKANFRPVYIPPGPVLDWINSEEFGRARPLDINSPTLKAALNRNGDALIFQGYALYNTIEKLFYLALDVNSAKGNPKGSANPTEGGAGVFVPTAAMNDTLNNENTPSTFSYERIDGPGKLKYRLVPNNLLNDNNELSSFFDVIYAHSHKIDSLPSKDNPYTFNVNGIKLYFIKKMSAAAIMPADLMSTEVKNFLADEGRRQEMLDEFNIVKEASDDWVTIRDDIKKKSKPKALPKIR